MNRRCSWAVLTAVLMVQGLCGAEVLPVDGLWSLPDDLVVEAGAGRTTHVRPSRPEELGPNPSQWCFYPPFEAAPPSPAQDALTLTPQDPLTIVVPMFAHGSSLGDFATRLHREGNRLILNAYFVWSGGTSGTFYGSHEYLLPIGPLEPGDYTLEINYLQLWVLIGLHEGPEDAEGFLDDPEGFMEAHWPGRSFDDGLTFVSISDPGLTRQTHEFTVVPEPNSLALLSLGGLALRRRKAL